MTAPTPIDGRLRLLVVSSYYDSHLGGLEIVAGTLARELAKSFDVTWAAIDATPAPKDLKTLSLVASNPADDRAGLPLPILHPKGIADLHRAVGESDVVLIHDTLYLTSIMALVSAKLRGKPVLILQHIGDNLFESRLVQTLARIAERVVSRPCLATADQVVFISEAVERHFARTRLKRPGLVSYSGIDTAAFRPARDPADKQRLRQKFDLTGPVALYAGRFVGKKGLGYLREMAAARPDVTFALAGGGAIDPTAWGLANVRVFAGLTGEPLADLYRASDVFVLPSPSEGFSLVIREAMACGLPVICSRQASGTDSQSTRFLHPVPLSIDDAPGNVHRLVAALDPALAAGGSDEASVFARRRYDWRRVADVYRGAVESIDRRSANLSQRALA